MDFENKPLDNSEKSFLQPVLTVNASSNGNGKYTVHTTKRSATKQVLLGLVANFTCVAPSMSLGFSAIVLPYLLAKDNPYQLTPSQGSWVASVASIATPLGSFLSGPLSDRFGRKLTFICVHIICCLGWFVIAAAYKIPDYQYPILIVGRLITGLSTGVASMPPSVYIAEISSPKLRGMFTTWSSIFFSIGVLIVYLLGYLNKEDWFVTAIISGIIPLVGILLVHIFIVESPTWLISVGECNKAKQSMCHLYSTKICTPPIQQEINTIITSRQKIQAAIEAKYSHLENPSRTAIFFSNLKYFTGPTCLKPFILMLGFFFFQQFSGTFVIIFYAVSIIQEAGVLMDAFIAAVIIAFTRLVAAVLVGFVSKSYGRRPPTIISGSGMTISMLLLGSYVLAKSQDLLSDAVISKFNFWLPMTLLTVYIFTSTLGFYAIPFAMTAELFPAKARGMASGLLTCVAYTFNFITVKFFPNMVKTMGSYGVFFLFGAFSLAGTIFVVLCLPETKGKTLEEIEEYFGKKKTKQATEKSLMINHDP
ncbi:facilitated trehalose transporter Tret1-2 homolog [Agrilus planipennis]|uniref:Facilitated trehalose transporter Tret1-2 homolog n=1 Tax=Agrilus planipennis TaxID=224129 RepID=A0A1W4WMJ0_AGRPL|nr:facilitated trehalose transporter Tret1-2 homolog [Agrilus planipennis]